nr:MAG TPA: hypothetical protein [Bacteriophage sp.]
MDKENKKMWMDYRDKNAETYVVGSDLQPKSITINADSLFIYNGGLDLNIDVSNVDFNKIDEIIINNVLFTRK